MIIYWFVMNNKCNSCIFENVKGSNNIVNFSLFLLTICNLKCSYCYARKNKKWGEMLSKSDLNKILSYLSKVDFDFKITLLGGEPTLYPYLKIVISELDRNKHCKVIEVFTNGMRYFNFNSNKIDLYMSYHKTSKNFNRDAFLKSYYKYKENYKITICSVTEIGPDLKLFKDSEIHYQNIVKDRNVSDNIDTDLKDKDMFNLNTKVVSLPYVIKNNISFKGWKCDMYNFLITKDYILDECNSRKYDFNEGIKGLKITRVCDKESCFLNGDFLLYNKKYK